MKHIISILLCLIIIILSACQTISPTVNAFYIEYEEETFTYRDINEISDRIDQLTDRMAAAHNMAEAARELGFEEDHLIIQIATEEWWEAHNKQNDYKTIYNDLEFHWQAKRDQYPNATYVWEFLMNAGYNDEVIAGIMGNMMAECGGHTLALDWKAQGTYYGICQWSRSYSEVWGANLEEQCKFLESTIRYELDTYGYMYKKGYSYEDFLLMTNPRDAALMFAKSYERCGSGTYRLRQKLAEEAYNYFIG